MYFCNFPSILGNLVISANETTLFSIRFAPPFENDKPNEICLKCCAYLDEYFKGKKPQLDFKISPIGTPFQTLIYSLLLLVPYGQVSSYGIIAKEVSRILGKDKMSAQAVGNAIGKNPIPIIIPCHRIIGSKGDLVGYSGGIDKKIALLELEKADTKHFFNFNV